MFNFISLWISAKKKAFILKSCPYHFVHHFNKGSHYNKMTFLRINCFEKNSKLSLYKRKTNFQYGLFLVIHELSYFHTIKSRKIHRNCRCKDRNLEIITLQNMLACLFLTDGSIDVMANLLILELTVLYTESIQVVIFHSRKSLPYKDHK